MTALIERQSSSLTFDAFDDIVNMTMMTHVNVCVSYGVFMLILDMLIDRYNFRFIKVLRCGVCCAAAVAFNFFFQNFFKLCIGLNSITFNKISFNLLKSSIIRVYFYHHCNKHDFI